MIYANELGTTKSKPGVCGTMKAVTTCNRKHYTTQRERALIYIPIHPENCTSSYNTDQHKHVHRLYRAHVNLSDRPRFAERVGLHEETSALCRKGTVSGD